MQAMHDPANHSNPIPFNHLLDLIGERFHLGNRIYTVIEVLPEGPCLILEANSGALGIQENQHGEPLRRTRTLMSLPVYMSGSKTLNPDLGKLAELLPRSGN